MNSKAHKMFQIFLSWLAMAAIVFFAISALPVAGQTVNESAKLLASDGAEFDAFGRSIAISGTTALIGSPGDDDNGSAYLFDTTTGLQIAKLLPSGGTAGDFFGSSVAISETTAIVGAPHSDDNGSFSGSAFLFDTSTGQQTAKLLPNDGAEFDQFGYSVAISGNTAVVGSRNDDDGSLYSGSMYLFDATTGQQIAKLLPSNRKDFQFFGTSVAISGNTAVAGAILDTSFNSTDSGSAYLFDTTTGHEIAKLLPGDGAPIDSFGYSVAISETTAVVGAPYIDDTSLVSGSAYLFDTVTGQQIAKLIPSDGAGSYSFGYSVAISGNTAAVGDYGENDNGSHSGSVYLFDTTTGQQIAKFLPSDGVAFDRFGWSVSISGATAVVGAPYTDDNSYDTGSAYVFDLSPTMHVLCVGVDEPLGLVGSVNAERIAQAFGDAGDRLHDFNSLVHPVVTIDTADNTAARQQLTDAIGVVRDVVKPGDTVMFYINAHAYYGGGNDELSVPAEVVPPVCDLNPVGCPAGQDCFGCPLDSTEDEYLILNHSGSIGMSDDGLRALFADVAFEEVNKLFIMDVCFAGGYWGDPDSTDSGDLNLPRAALIAASPEANHSLAAGDLGAVAAGGIYTGLLGRAVAGGVESISDGSALSGVLLVGAIDLAYRDLRQDLILSGNPAYILGDPAYWGVPLTDFKGQESITVLSAPDFDAFGDGPLGEPGEPCLADTNGDGVVTPADFSAWVAAFNSQAAECDQNDDGSCTPADFSAWVANYNAGCD